MSPDKKRRDDPTDEPGPNMHFQRRDGRYIDYEPDRELFETLPYMDEDILEGLGLQLWSSDTDLWLFPVEWYEDIPEGLEIVTINEEEKKFDRNEDKKEARFGALPYGIVREKDLSDSGS